ncbi:Exosome complex component CSL4 [Coelomomyces lativittatus]|nr:Exosome complex component CSL4 [Coelomomyces lativittatus]KAJ1515161.1 Exosome complex component CSL4 [Coelomomyces lativittatus]KAJ1517911.1 Exosome complex component CSL4 [Coelomomyces lativittatus]
MPSSSGLVVPGEKLCPWTAELNLGPGTYVHDHEVYASLLGIYHPPSSNTLPKFRPYVQGFQGRSVLPTIGSQITGQVKRMNTKLAILAIRMVESVPVKEEFEGILKIENVRSSETSQLQMYDCFRPGDIVRADVLSLGESQSYILSTARNDLGVVYAQSATGATLVPISWEEMQCPDTGVIERRKVCRLDLDPHSGVVK